MATPTSGTNETGNHILCDHVLYMHLHCVYLHKSTIHDPTLCISAQEKHSHEENRGVRFRKCEKIVLCEEERGGHLLKQSPTSTHNAFIPCFPFPFHLHSHSHSQSQSLVSNKECSFHLCGNQLSSNVLQVWFSLTASVHKALIQLHAQP